METCKYLFLFVGLIAACGNVVVEDPETITTESTSIETTTTTTTNNVCIGEPYSEMPEVGFETWAKSDCTGDFASVGLSNGYPCVRWAPSGDTYCVDLNQPVDNIYFHNTNNDGNCEQWTEYQWPWYVWKFCGNKPAP